MNLKAMSEVGEDFKALHEESKRKRAANEKWSINFLKEKGIPFSVLNESSRHYRVGEFDFWPSTGKFYNQKKQIRGRGVKNLIALL
ncbi:MAG TPA: hypothetical protein VKR52_04500 [Terracidiphilus sp.]|nr:hypothetical protein [Terracidiphilus sp.]